MRLKLFLIFFVISITTIVEGAEIEPVSLGVVNGNITQYVPNVVIINVYPDVVVSYAGLLAIQNKFKNIANYIVETRTDQIKTLLETAKKSAIDNKSPFYAVSNLNTKTSIGDNIVIVETMGDIVSLRYK